ncbi:hypothetical protein HBB16_01825 [Pseudonocardia sp. MCCB 268]|nr:hypothetical protein [Pseudonocardia cytotoxica]
MRVAAASAFESWLAVLEQRFAEAGMTAGTARDTAVQIFAPARGLPLLARTTRSTSRWPPQAVGGGHRCRCARCRDRRRRSRGLPQG